VISLSVNGITFGDGRFLLVRSGGCAYRMVLWSATSSFFASTTISS
jgi:hypothetical protein